jgi:hypothetical protein
MSNLNWQGDALIKDLLIASDKGVERAALVVMMQAKANLTRRGATYKQISKGNKAIKKAAEKGNVAQTLLKRIGRNPVTGRLKSRSGIGVAIRGALQQISRGDVDPEGGFPRTRTGRLERSMAIGYVGPPVLGERWVGSAGGPGNPVTGYAAAQEFGSRKLNLPARPYIRPAFDSTQGEQVEAFVRASQAYLESKNTQ